MAYFDSDENALLCDGQTIGWLYVVGAQQPLPLMNPQQLVVAASWNESAIIARQLNAYQMLMHGLNSPSVN